MLTPHEIGQRHAMIRNAIASQRLEGIDLDKRTVAELEAWARGEMDIADAIKQLTERVKRGEILS